MAEAAGLAVGIAGLAVSFKACIELFDCFYTAKTLDRDFSILVTKLDIEKPKLLQWGEQAHILQPDRRRPYANRDALLAALPIFKFGQTRVSSHLDEAGCWNRSLQPCHYALLLMFANRKEPD